MARQPVASIAIRGSAARTRLGLTRSRSLKGDSYNGVPNERRSIAMSES